MLMKLILRADVDNLGRLGDEVKVKPGFGRNYLIPQGLAMPATTANRKLFETDRKKLQARMDAVKAEAQSIADKLAGLDVIIRVRTGEGDKMYGSVTPAVISETLAGLGVELDKRKLDLEEPIRALGTYEIRVKLHQDVQAQVKVLVVKHDWTPGQDTPAEQAAGDDAGQGDEETTA